MRLLDPQSYLSYRTKLNCITARDYEIMLFSIYLFQGIPKLLLTDISKLSSTGRNSPRKTNKILKSHKSMWQK